MVHLTCRTSLNSLPIWQPLLDLHHKTNALLWINGGWTNYPAATEGGVKKDEEEKQ
jgi:hypothetical protein